MGFGYKGGSAEQVEGSGGAEMHFFWIVLAWGNWWDVGMKSDGNAREIKKKVRRSRKMEKGKEERKNGKRGKRRRPDEEIR